MALVFVSTFPPFECGIANYTKFLVEEMARSGKSIIVLSEGGDNIKTDKLEVKKVYGRKENFASQIFKAVEELPELPEIIHFQHAPDLFPDKAAFIMLLKSLKEKNIPLAVTLHTVYRDPFNLYFYNKISRYAHIIVHNEVCREMLKKIPNVSVIFHGTSIFSFKKDRDLLRKEMGYSGNDTIFLFAGFIHAQKNLHTVIMAFKALYPKNKSLKLIVTGRPSGNRWYNWLYLKLCKIFGGNSGIKWDIGFIKTEKLEEYLHISDVVLLPYWQKYASASGIFHLAIGSGKPFICSESAKFAEAKDIFSEFPLFVPMISIAKWKKSITFIAENKEIRSKISELVVSYAQETSWKNACKKHYEVYKKVINGEK